MSFDGMGEVGLSLFKPLQIGCEMSIEHLKKQAKNLRRLLPEFLASNQSPYSLAACQALIARSSGFPSWHAAVANSAGLPKTGGGPARKTPTTLPVDVAALADDVDLEHLFMLIVHLDPDCVEFVNGEIPDLAKRLADLGFEVKAKK